MAAHIVYDAYICWLYDKVMFKQMKRSGRSYALLLDYLMKRKFTCKLDRDVNRAEDGKYLRYTFCEEIGIPDEEIKGSCTFLEMAVALAERINDDIFPPTPGVNGAQFFWMMMENCGLDEYIDSDFDEEKVGKIVDCILERRFSYNGSGGFFPLKHPKEDQKCVEMWYEMQQYMQENYEF